jgi:hypothetical protein
MSQNPGQVRVVQGVFGDECTTTNDLMQNQNLKPEVKKMMYHVDQRQLSTLITSGAVGPWGVNVTELEKFGKAPDGTPIGSSSLQFAVQGRLDQASTILQQVGASGADGSFQLLLKDKYIYKGHVVLFQNAGRYSAICTTEPVKTAGGYLYNFMNQQSEVFVYATHAAPNGNGTATCMAVTTNYGEGSNKGYSRTMHPDRFIVDMTIQRKSVSVTGAVANQVTWYETEVGGEMVRGWKYTAMRQAEALFSGENEYAKIFGVSTMKNADGTRRQFPVVPDLDAEDGIIAGDGIEEQIAGGNEIFGSGTSGEATEDDFIDMIKLLIRKSNSANGKINIVLLTGVDGFFNFQEKAARIASALNIEFKQSVNGGDANVVSGVTFTQIHYGGSTITCMQHPMFDDAKKFSATSTISGRNIMSGTYMGGNIEGEYGKNIEIIPRGAHGGNRSMVTADLKGMTGVGAGAIITQKDADTYAMLKEDLIVIYNTQNWAILRQS